MLLGTSQMDAEDAREHHAVNCKHVARLSVVHVQWLGPGDVTVLRQPAHALAAVMERPKH